MTILSNHEHPINVGVLDTGLDVTHLSLQEKIHEFVAIDKEGNVRAGKVKNLDKRFHGTHIAGIICSEFLEDNIYEQTDFDIQLNLISIEQTSKVILNLLRGIDYLLNWDIQIACLPIGINPKTPIFKPLIDAFEQKGILTIVPIGNRGDGKYCSPGWYPNVLSVGAVDSSGQPAKFSGCYYNHEGKCLKPDVLAPGVDILSAVPGNKTDRMSGTSMACAYVTKIAAKLLQERPELNSQQLKRLLIESAVDMPKLPKRHYNYEKGIVDFNAAINWQSTFDNISHNINDSFFENTYIDPYFQHKYSHAKNDEIIDSIIAIKELNKHVNPDSTRSNKAIQKILDKKKCGHKINRIVLFKNVNMAYIQASKTFYDSLLNEPQLSMISAVDIDIFGVS